MRFSSDDITCPEEIALQIRSLGTEMITCGRWARIGGSLGQELSEVEFDVPTP